MIGVLKLLIDSAVKLVPVGELLKQRRSDQSAAIGLRMFDLYRATIAVAENGGSILTQLRWVVRAHRKSELSGKPSGQVQAALDLTKSLVKQSDRIDELLEAYRALRPLIEIADRTADADEFLRMEASLNFKSSMLGLGAAYLRPAIGPGLAEARGTGVQCLFSEIFSVKSPANALDLRPEEAIAAALERGSVWIDKVPWHPEITDLAEVYLDSGLGTRRLGELIDSATKLRISFQAVFNLQDVLLAHERRMKAMDSP